MACRVPFALGEVFSRHDPPAVAVALTAPEFEEFVRLLCPKAAIDVLTIVARLAGTGELVGARLTEDSASVVVCQNSSGPCNE
jgi:hypothetical protein